MKKLNADYPSLPKRRTPKLESLFVDVSFLPKTATAGLDDSHRFGGLDENK